MNPQKGMDDVNTTRKSKQVNRERRWVLFNNGCIHGIHHSEVVMVRSVPHRSMVRNSVAVFTVSRMFGVIAALSLAVILALLLTGCGLLPHAQKGGSASSTISRPGHTNSTTLSQSENPKEPSKQTVQSEQTVQYVLPPGTALVRDQHVSAQGDPAAVGLSPGDRVILSQPMPVKYVTKDRTETSIGGAQKDTLREWAGKAANLHPVMWAGIAMMTLVAGVLVYFGWWTKAGVAVVVGIGMVVLAQTLPDHGTVILLGGLGVFALAALLILYAYHKGQLDKNQNGIPDFLEQDRTHAH